jgi:hypothetical protein
MRHDEGIKSMGTRLRPPPWDGESEKRLWEVEQQSVVHGAVHHTRKGQAPKQKLPEFDNENMGTCIFCALEERREG